MRTVATQHTIVFLDRDTVGASLRQPNFPHSYKEYADTPVSCIVDRLRDATIAILNKVPMPDLAGQTACNSGVPVDPGTIWSIPDPP
jgi:hypothetical protein